MGEVNYKEIGSSGNYFVGGYEVYEYQTELQGIQKYIEYDKMKRGSAMARATLRATILPLLGARWYVTTKGRSKSDKAQVEFVERNLFECTTQSWQKILFQILQNLAYGMYPFEKVWIRSKNWEKWRYKGDWIVLKKLAPRHPSTITKFLFDENGGIAGLEQTAYFNRKDSTSMDTVTIPIDKLIIFVTDQEGDNYEGVSLFRTGYGHWRQIKAFYNIAAIGAERMCLGFPVFEHPENFWDLSPTDRQECKDMFAKILKNFRAHKHMGAIIPPKARLHIVKGEFNFVALERLISHHEMKIAQSSLATFLKIGEARVGSHALSKDHSDFFLRSLQAIGEDVCDTINTYLIPQMISYNFKEIDYFPELKVRNIGARDLKEFAEIIQTLIASKILHPDEEGELEDELRKVFDLPARTELQKKRTLQLVKEAEEDRQWKRLVNRSQQENLLRFYIQQNQLQNQQSISSQGVQSQQLQQPQIPTSPAGIESKIETRPYFHYDKGSFTPPTPKLTEEEEELNRDEE